MAKKEKISSKERFKVNRKAKMNSSFTPKFLTTNFDLTEVTDDGIFLFKKGLANKVYELILEEPLDTETAYKVLRDLDEEFALFYFNQETYLMLSVKANTITEAIDSFDAIEGSIKPKLTKCSVEMADLTFQERMKLIHGRITKGLEEKSVAVTDYFKEINGYYKDFLLQEYDSYDESYITTNTDMIFQSVFIRKLSSFPNEMLKEIVNLPFVSACKIGFEAIPDKAIPSFIENTYMGFEKELKIINKQNPELYDIYTAPPTAEDTKAFAMCGISFLFLHESREEMSNNFTQVAEIFNRYKCSFEIVFGNLLQNFLSFVPFQTRVPKQYRLEQGEKASSFFLAGRTSEIKDGSELFERVEYVQEEPGETETAFEYGDETDETIEEASSVFDYLI